MTATYVPVNRNLAPASPTPQDSGYVAWVDDPFNVQGGTIMVGGTLYLGRLPIRQDATITRLVFSISAVAVTPVAGQSWCGYYDSLGNKLCEAALDSVITGSGVVSVTVPSISVLAGTYIRPALLANAATLPQLHRFTTASTPPNAGYLAADFRSCVNGTGLTALPATITPASNTGTGAITYFAGAA